MSSLSGEAGLTSVADFFESSGLQNSGYKYINTDEGWETKNRDANGKLQWSASAYPSGLPNFTASLHARGFLFGIYGAASGVTCGVNPGQLYHETIDAQSFADWGVDYVKSDNCATYALDPSVRFGAMRDAMNRTGRPMVLSVEPFSIVPDPAQSRDVAHLWRTGQDIAKDFASILDRADKADQWAPLAGPGGAAARQESTDGGSPRAPTRRRGIRGRRDGANGSLRLRRGRSDNDAAPTRRGRRVAAASGADGARPVRPSGGWNDPDMIHVQNDPGLTLGENRVYFGLWALMKAPLLLSADLADLSQDVVAIINNTEVVALNQDAMGVAGRKLAVDGAPLPWLVGLADCAPPDAAARPRGFGGNVADARAWDVSMAADGNHTIKNAATGRCLAATGADGTDRPGKGGDAVVLLPCDGADASQRWIFDKGLHTVTSITSAQTGSALAAANSSLYGAAWGDDPAAAPGAAYGFSGLVAVPPVDEGDCESRDCDDYDPAQMWYYSPADGRLRHALSGRGAGNRRRVRCTSSPPPRRGDSSALSPRRGKTVVTPGPSPRRRSASRDDARPRRYTASMNHHLDGDGYSLTPEVPTWRHHCLVHALATDNLGSPVGDAEVWGGPLSNGDYALALANRGSEDANVTAAWDLLEVDSAASFVVRDLWAGADLGTFSRSFSAVVPSHDVGLYRLTPA